MISRTSFIFPHENEPSEHLPETHEGPAFLKRAGETSFTSASILQASSLISHCAREQQRKEKKL
jgi:hypothetical protein